ncbi:hypothetical protein AB0I49_07085 [Streptomyces sp. NPDC050617]|uniref:hypothetical protein n=1 Tax=Streptomyces sp. NPDC050617 TaxID=3154628 RepID=UPI003426139E
MTRVRPYGAVRGYPLRVTAVHRRLLDGGQGVPAVPAQRKARREYENRVRTLAPIAP